MIPATLSSVSSSAANAVSSGIQRIRDGLSFSNVLTQTPAKDASSVATSPHSEIAANDLRTQLETSLKKFRDAILRRFAGAGIDTSVPVQLHSDGLGGVNVAGQHPDRLAIEQLFASDEELTSTFNQLAAQHAQLQSLDAPALDAHPLLDNSPFSLRLSGNEIQIES
jgi:hypothetical protein